MRLEGVRKLFGSLTRRAGRLRQVQVSDASCTSVSGVHSMSLPGKFLCTAAQMRVEFTVLWPLLRLKCFRGIRVSLFSGDHDESKGVPCHCDVRPLDGHRTQVSITLPQQAGGKPSMLALEVIDCGNGRRLNRFCFQVLDQRSINRLMLDNLRIHNRRLWVRSGKRWHLAENVSDSSDFLMPEFVLSGSNFVQFVPPLVAPVCFSLKSPANQVHLGCTTVTCSDKTQVIRANPVPIGDRRLFPRPCVYSIVAALEGRELGTLSFRLVGEGELVQQVRVRRIELQTETREGKVVAGLGILQWNEHRSIRPCLQVETAICAPNTLVPCTVRLFRGSTEIRSEEFVLPLDKVSRHVRLDKLELAFPERSRERPARLMLSASIGDGVRASSTILILPAERIANFEGQLTADPKDLPFEEIEYDEILRGLRMFSPAAPRRKFWRDPS
jgi:hypothetical protein